MISSTNQITTSPLFKIKDQIIELIDKYDRQTVIDVLNVVFSKKEVDLFFDVFDLTNNGKPFKTRRDLYNEFKDIVVEQYKVCIVTGAKSDRCQVCHISKSPRYYMTLDNSFLMRADLFMLFSQHKISIDPTSKELVIHPALLTPDNPDLIKINKHKITMLPPNTYKLLADHFEIFRQKL